MSYSAKINSANPSAIVILLDGSGSMSEMVEWGGCSISKAQAVAQTINNLLFELVARAKGESGYRSYFDVAVVGYHDTQVVSLLPTSGEWFLSTSQLASAVKRVETRQQLRTLADGRSVLTNSTHKVWIEPMAQGRTPMKAALQQAYSLLRSWCALHGSSFAPLVINITDGEATDGPDEKLLEMSDKVRSLTTNDGNVILMNIHISSQGGESVLFPRSVAGLSDNRYARLLYDMSSTMPEVYAREIGYMLGVEPASDFRAFAYNASISELIRTINIGSTTINNNL